MDIFPSLYPKELIVGVWRCVILRFLTLRKIQTKTILSPSAAVYVGHAEGGLACPGLRKAETLVDRLCGLSLIDPKESLEGQEQSDSLMQHIKVGTQVDL